MTALRLADGDEVGLDGVLDEAFWSRAVPATDFIQVDPDNGQPATEETEVRIVYTREALYIGVRAFDSEPDRWLGYQRRRDEFLGSDDRFMWTIDTFLDGRSGYFFEMNPAGLMADALLGVNGQNRQWDGIWNARHNHDNLGWTLEIEIPFRTLNFDPDNDAWGTNFQRTVRRKNEDSIWMGWARNQGLRRMTNAGRVTGISEVTQGNGLDIKPYGVFTSQKIGDLAVSNDGNAGLDIFYNPTPGMRATVTFNTDFAQTEVDDRQVNLTQFSLFFPEKRDFFLDGAPFFDFGSPQNGLRVNPFFSRRVGLNADGTAQKIDFGTKVTGQMGLQDVGVLHVRTGNEDGVIGEDITVARVKRRMLSQSYVGELYTRRDSRVAGEDALHTVGADLRLATSTFLGSQNLEATGWWLTATTGDAAVTDDRAAFGATISYPNDRWSGGLDLREVQENFAPSLGFVSRAGYRRYMPNVQFAPRPNAHPYIRQFTFSTTVDVQTDMANDLLKREVSARMFGVSMHLQESFSFNTTQTRERLDRPFRIARRFELPVGSVYNYTRFQVNFQTANRRILALSGRYGWGNFFSGTRNETVLNLTLRARPGYDRVSDGRVESHRGPGGHGRDAPVPPGGRDAVHTVRGTGQHLPVRHGEPGAGLAVATPLDYHAGQRPLSRLHPQLGRRPDPRSVPDARTAPSLEGPLHVPLLGGVATPRHDSVNGHVEHRNKTSDRNADAIMPPTTVVPTEFRLAAPAPVATANGSTPRMKVNDVIRIGRRRMRAASVTASRIE